MSQSAPIVSVALITYNQEKYIAQCIEGIIMQETDFPFEVVISDDCSTDNTRTICCEYHEKYPGKIRLSFPKKNLGMIGNWKHTLTDCTGKYTAICEGDDYWSDPYKLQKQVSFMEQHPDYSMSAHATDILWYDKEVRKSPDIKKEYLTTKDIISQEWSLMTASILFRTELLDIPLWFDGLKNADYALQLLLSTKGKIGYLSDNMAVYRRHFEGISATSQYSPMKAALILSGLFGNFNSYSGGKYKPDTRKRLEQFYKKCISDSKYYKLKRETAGLYIAYYFYLAGIDILPFLSRLSIFSKK